MWNRTHTRKPSRGAVCVRPHMCLCTFVNTHTCTQEIRRWNKSETKRGSKTGYIPLSSHPQFFDIASSSSSPGFSSCSLPHSLRLLSSTLTACDVSDCYGLLIMAVFSRTIGWLLSAKIWKTSTGLSLSFCLSLSPSFFLSDALSLPLHPPYSHLLIACICSCYTRIVKELYCRKRWMLSLVLTFSKSICTYACFL